jgi:hypothetical protein
MRQEVQGHADLHGRLVRLDYGVSLNWDRSRVPCASPEGARATSPGLPAAIPPTIAYEPSGTARTGTGTAVDTAKVLASARPPEATELEVNIS